ncbi:MAG: GNAT family N-acetyltransferase [Acidobacteriota bacterium]|nr:MAG: GNAT family N-acetyltransferase [Acidobacteriota bacterium]
MSTGAEARHGYPWTTTINGREITLRLMSRADLEGSVQFARELPAEDLMFLTVDITDPVEMEQYVAAVEKGQAATVLAESGGRFVGYGSLAVSQPHWTRHLGEIRLLVGPDWRGFGLGRLLANEVMRIARDKGLRKVIARMAADQKSAIQVFEHLGFHAEALLADFVIDRDGRTHDVIVMTHDVTGLS